MGKRLAIEHDLIRPNEVIELLEMMGGKNKDNADGCSFLYYTLCTPKINNPNNEKVICGFTNLKMQNDYFAIFTLEKFWKKYPYKLNDLVLCDDGLLGVITKMEWDCEKSDMKYRISSNTPDYNKWYSSKNIKCKYMAGKKLAIKGHPTRGKKVIELLEMMGGKNTYGYTGDMESLYFSIYNDTIIYGSDKSFLNDKYVYFTLEEFLEKYPFKEHDKVIDKADGCTGVVCEMKWDEDVSDMKYCVAFANGVDFGWFVNDSIEFCKEIKPLFKSGDVVKLKGCPDKNIFWIVMDVVKDGYIFNDGIKYSFDDQHHYEKTNREVINIQPEITAKVTDKNNCDIECPCGYEFYDENDNLIGTKVLMRRKKAVYPKTYEECCEILGIGSYFEPEIRNATAEECRKFTELIRLKRCRDAYWKIAGEEMGLGKPWGPDWKKQDKKYIISVFQDTVIYFENETYNHNTILAFPTEKIRDMFFENFKDLIEQCKELL